MNTLHLLSCSPTTGNYFNNCLCFVSAGDALLLTGDAVYALYPNTLFYEQLLQLKDVQLFALDEDLTARAIQTATNHVTIIDYAKFVDLCVMYSKTCSWL